MSEATKIGCKTNCKLGEEILMGCGKFAYGKNGILQVSRLEESEQKGHKHVKTINFQVYQ